MGTKKTYDLEERTYEFARNCRFLVRKLLVTVSNIEDGKQLIKSPGSVGSNYIEANEKLGDKDLKSDSKFLEKSQRIKILATITW